MSRTSSAAIAVRPVRRTEPGCPAAVFRNTVGIPLRIVGYSEAHRLLEPMLLKIVSTHG
jgi:hypothetical protein